MSRFLRAVSIGLILTGVLASCGGSGTGTKEGTQGGPSPTMASSATSSASASNIPSDSATQGGAQTEIVGTVAGVRESVEEKYVTCLYLRADDGRAVVLDTTSNYRYVTNVEPIDARIFTPNGTEPIAQLGTHVRVQGRESTEPAPIAGTLHYHCPDAATYISPVTITPIA